MRFDDSLKTVLSADMATGFGAQSAWRQLVDLMGRGRAVADESAIERLRVLREAVPASVRAASARALAFASPGAALVGFFAEDELAIAAPVLRMVTLPAADWLGLLPRLSPTGRSVLRHRRDLPAEVARGLQSFGAVDFVLPQPELVAETFVEPVVETVVESAPAVEPVPAPVATPGVVAAPLSETPFMALGDIARGLPVVAQAFRHIAAERSSDPARFEISDLVARIDAFNRDRVIPPAPPVAPRVEAESFRFETDASGVIRWIEGVTRSPLVGVSLAHATRQGDAQVDGVVAGAFRRRSRFGDARLQVGGQSDAAGAWRMSGIPAFDHDSGRFTGMRGTARRPRADEVAERMAATSPVSDSLRQLVHELRTPTNAIAGFAELIETELLGPVSPTYRERATAIRTQAGDLLAAIDDLDTAARIEGHALDLRPTIVPVVPLLERVVRDLAPLASLRGATLLVDPGSSDCAIAGDDRVVERLVGRLLAALVSACGQGERIGIATGTAAGEVSLAFDRPRALPAHAGDTLLSIDAEDEIEGAPLLGTGFTLRLVQNLAGELGGGLTIDVNRLTLRLPSARDRGLGQASDTVR
ncbi:sensor histidine kinase [Sphingomonas ginsenosidivorax]|uniref:sensor histidine kinase n=1 Tax=Sphingomonas ginsenosidivorax TaxID=862135 RepID=UPI001F559C15|nr:HAMP domain-containing sensor histidine kinase [Sphingomonas ginsenosidivorax]